jgi:molecular chaperone GrpE
MKEDIEFPQAQNPQAIHEDASKAGLSNEQQEEQSESLAVEQLHKVRAELAEANDKYIRLYADFDNLRRRVAKEKLTIIANANQDILKKLLEIVDDFERAMASSYQAGKDQDATWLYQGVKLIYDKFLHLLQQAGVKPMEVNQGSEFNAELYEAVMTQAVAEDTLKGKVVEVVEKGYYLKDQVLRVAKVVIGA